MVWVLAAGLALVALGMGIKVALLRHGMKALRQDLVERRGQDTNTLLSLPCRDRELRRLASALNDELRALRQERLRYQQGDKELKEAVVNISHDLRTPLTAISGYLQLLQGQDLPPDTRRYLEQIGGRTHAMKRLTEELFRYSVVMSEENLAREPVDLRRAVEEYGIPQDQAASVLHRFDHRRSNFYHANTGRSWREREGYHMVLDSGLLGVELCSQLLVAAAQSEG